MAVVDDLIAYKARLTAQLAALDIGPDYSLDGQSVQKSQMRKEILDEIERLNELILQEQPFSIRTQQW